MSAMAAVETDDEDEDEETLQLKLQEIQARLKLKKLQKAKAVGMEAIAAIPKSVMAPNLCANSSAATRGPSSIAGLREERIDREKLQASVHVPVSPVRKVQAAEATRSPSKVLLGIDKGLKASDVSLKKPPRLRKPTEELMDNVRRAGSYLHRTNSQMANHDPFAAVPSLAPTQTRPAASFSERMTKIRDEEATRRDVDARIKKARSKTFDIDQKEMEYLKSAAIPLPDMKPQEPEFSRDQVLNSFQRPAGGLLAKSKSTSHLSTARTASGSTISTLTPSVADSQSSSRLTTKSPASSVQSTPTGSQTGAEFESFSSLHLSKRIIPHNTLTRTLAGKRTFTLPDLLREVKAPGFRLPDIEEDIVALAIVASKSEPKNQKNGSGSGQKFMVLTLCDLKWEMDLYLFDTGFQKYWKLTTGTVISILNPAVMKPIKTDTGRFSLAINSSDDTILEIGSARDLGYCKTMKKDGNQCGSWIDKRHTEYCEFHVNEAVKKTRASRMEINTMSFGHKSSKTALYAGYGERKINSRDSRGYMEQHAERRTELLKKKQGISFDRESMSTVYTHKGQGHFDGEIGEKVQRAETTRKRLAEKEKERELQRKLASMGDGLGADYMKAGWNSQQAHSQPSQSNDRDGGQWEPEPPPDAKALGLLDGKASEMQLGPVKRKRAGTASGSMAMGWGGHLTKELGRMKDGERLQPVKKKTRFVTEKGIREAGRESFGGDAAKSVGDDNDDDDDDDLEIIK